MKLRNKKTGEVVDVESLGHAESLKEKYGYQVTLSWATEYENLSQCRTYKTLAELNEEWEDYKPEEPKLNGEVREIVRHWARLYGYDWVRVGFAERATQTIFWVESPDTREHIEFLGAYVADDFEAGDYSIEELCGEDDDEA